MSPGEVDVRVLRSHLEALREALGVLAQRAGRDLAHLRARREEQWIVERGLQLCAQNVLDMATHIAASEGVQVPDYASAIGELGRLAVLPADFAQRFQGVAGFRNVLVHGYLEVDLALVHRLLNQRLGDFEVFAGYVEKYLRTVSEIGD
jgi:uncharacterized protein YutE (UPF0331/DUF86 family)